jgi:hypothetical protein
MYTSQICLFIDVNHRSFFFFWLTCFSFNNSFQTFLKKSLFQGHAERQVLVQDYKTGASVAFDQRIRNLKEVFASDGCKMYVSLALLFFVIWIMFWSPSSPL